MSTGKTKRFGQNFLVNSRAAHRIASEFHLKEGEIALEIGPGRGALTKFLAESGARLYAVEKDPSLSRFLEEMFNDNPEISIINADILQHDFKDFCAPPGSEKNVLRIIGNLPYSISKPVLMKIISERLWIRDFLLMLQKEVADRVLSRPKSRNYSPLSVLFSLTSTIRRVMELSPRSFSPPPKVHSTVIHGKFLDRPGFEDEEEEKVRQIVSALFSKRRKTIRNNLSSFLKVDDRKVTIILEGCCLDPESRAETLDPEDFVRISRSVSMKAGGILL
ncbi:MAG: 16S rRNA (adenine(1518)-N(6)/adenine(1519)-N(6))-dimethyltransferase RsmA [Acidobacteriota bacterium]